MDTPNMATALHSYPPPPLPMPQMGQFAPTPAPTLTQQQQDETDRARAYKSRNKRPCDFCRSVSLYPGLRVTDVMGRDER